MTRTHKAAGLAALGGVVAIAAHQGRNRSRRNLWTTSPSLRSQLLSGRARRPREVKVNHGATEVVARSEVRSNVAADERRWRELAISIGAVGALYAFYAYVLYLLFSLIF